VSITFGSCRTSLPHEPPYVLSQDEAPEGHGIDALRSFALRAAGQAPDGLPSCLVLLGDQIYADQLSPAMRERVGHRSRPDEQAAEELIDFDEYAEAYVEAWSEPAIRWLLSTVPSVMVFDDHEIRGEWKISEGWLQEMRAESRYSRQVPDGLMAYWIYQHIGNLGLDELRGNELLRRVRSQRDAGALLRDEMTAADCQAGHSRWSYRRDLGRTRLVVIDSRAGRELEPGARRLIGDGEWEWVSIHHGGGVGIGYSQHAGMVVVADGTDLAAQKLERVLTTDPAMGVLRHVDAGYDRAIEVAEERGIRVPMLDGQDRVLGRDGPLDARDGPTDHSPAV
jgi:hypothetical protein